MTASPPVGGRLLLVSNRLPVTARLHDGEVRLSRATGGLATGLRDWHRQASGVWIGWPGEVESFTPEQRRRLDAHLERRRVVPVYLTAAEIEEYYEGFANRVLWPLFHYQIDRVPVDATGWEAYQRVNERFAEVVARQYRPGDTIWVHDYQLLLLPQMLRDRLPTARIGFFLHIPFPSSEVFRILPWRRELMHGMLGADLVGFHTFSYLRHFLMSLVHVDGLEADVDSVQVGARRVRLGVYPMGVDAGSFATLAGDPRVEQQLVAIKEAAAGRRILLGIDRLDYTKGIPRRLLAVERLLRTHRHLCDDVRYIQIAVPSRGMVDSYAQFKRQVEEMVGRINGAYGTLRSTPIHYMHGTVSQYQLAALYRAADVMVVTPLRDGMNLVAKEFVATRVDGDGVLLLSEFAGAAAELGDAVVVNPYDVDAMAEAMRLALTMPVTERRERMARLRNDVVQHSVQAWATSFLEALGRENRPSETGAAVDPRTILAQRSNPTSRVFVLLDYDGTLVPLAPLPHLAVPDAEVLQLVDRLARSPGVDVHVVSGRTRESLAAWFSGLPVSLWAEHAFWHRPAGGGAWHAASPVPTDWMTKVLPIFEQFTAATPGSLLEPKTVSLAWHYRMTNPEFGARQAHELRMLLGDTLSNQPLEVLEGHKVIEVRYRGMNKSAVAYHLTPADDATIIAIGDDRTDEDLFGALPETATTVCVGHRPSRAKYRLPDHLAVRQLLEALIDQRHDIATARTPPRGEA